MKSLNRHIMEIRSGGWQIIWIKIRALLEYFSILICGIWAVPTILIIRCLRPWRIIRFSPIGCSRIGCFALEVGHAWAVSQLQEKNYLNLYWFNYRPISNEFLAEMARRNFFISPFIHPLDFWNQIIPGGAMHRGPTAVNTEFRDIHGLLEKTKNKLMLFLPEEDALATDWLRRHGWHDDEPFVCLLVRDSSYMDNFPVPNTEPRQNHADIKFCPKTGYGWNHLDCRDSDIASYVPAAEWLANQGVWVLRMGKVMAKPIPSSHERIIDYAFEPDKSDFLDIWFFAHCDLCITTFTGPDIISDNYRRPILALNFPSLQQIFSWSDAMHVPKTLIWRETGKFLTVGELFDINEEYYDRIGITVIDLTPETILAAVQERWQRLQGTWIDTEDDLRRHHGFWEILKLNSKFSLGNNWIHAEARAGTVWLRCRNDEFLK